jgi:hypothetical protein
MFIDVEGVSEIVGVWLAVLDDVLVTEAVELAVSEVVAVKEEL